VTVAGLLAGLLMCVPAQTEADWMASAYLGHVWTRSSTVTLALPDRQTALEIGGVEYRAESLTSPQYYGYRVTWIPDAHSWVGVEVELIHAKVYAEAERPVRFSGRLDGADIDATLPLSSVVQRLAMSHGLNFVLANVVLRRELSPVDATGTPRFVIVARAGVGPTVSHSETTVQNVSRDQYEGAGVGVQVAGGFEAMVWKGLVVLGEYKFTRATPQLELVGGTITVPARSHHVVGGLAYRF
jgi:opacity protein-like surface antigen